MSPVTEERLRDVLGTLADQVTTSPDAYQRTQAEWRRRERRRRVCVVALAVVVIAIADIAGLWALNQARSGSPVVFDGPAPVRLPEPPRMDTAPAPERGSTRDARLQSRRTR
jgi:hypothetical protein